MYHGKPYDPTDISAVEVQHIGRSEILLSDLLREMGFALTSGDIRNALSGNSVRLNGEVITDPKYNVSLSSEGILVEMGKKKAKRVFL